MALFQEQCVRLYCLEDYALFSELAFKDSAGNPSNRDFEFDVHRYTLVFGVNTGTCKQKLWNLVFHEEVHVLVMQLVLPRVVY